MVNPALLVGFDTPYHAGVYRLDDERALVVTADFITPVVDDPATFGAVAAANSLSDVYAMGGRPLTALSIIAFPVESLSLRVMNRLLQGGVEKMAEQLGHYLRGWIGYFGQCQTPSVLMDLEQWTRRRLRSVIWNQWNRGSVRFAELCRRGIGRDLAFLTRTGGETG